MRMLVTAATSIAALLSSGQAQAEGVLNIYNRGEYTSPELIGKFEATYDVQGGGHRLRFQ